MTESAQELPSGLFFADRARFPAIEKLAASRHCQVLAVDLAGAAETRAILERLGNELHFPDWYGSNFDALYDCLSDPDWQAANGHLLLLGGLSNWQSTIPDDFAILIDVLLAVVETRQDSAKPFCILIDTPADGLAPLPQ